MKSIGTLIKELRSAKKISRIRLESQTKIKKNFLEDLEEERWSRLPDFPTTAGFVRNIANYLGMDEKKAVALLRRDFPPRVMRINPNPGVVVKKVWSPRATFFLVFGALFLFVLGYLLFQYVNFTSPPKLEVRVPAENEAIIGESLIIEGYADPNASLVANNQPVFIDELGNFKSQLPVYEGTKEVVFIAKSRAGRETRVVRQISVKSN